MKKLIYILIAFVIFLSFTSVNVFAGEIDKSKQGENEFTKNVAIDTDIDLNIDAKVVSDEELKSGVGKVRLVNLIKKTIVKFNSPLLIF